MFNNACHAEIMNLVIRLQLVLCRLNRELPLVRHCSTIALYRLLRLPSRAQQNVAAAYTAQLKHPVVTARSIADAKAKDRP